MIAHGIRRLLGLEPCWCGCTLVENRHKEVRDFWDYGRLAKWACKSRFD